MRDDNQYITCVEHFYDAFGLVKETKETDYDGINKLYTTTKEYEYDSEGQKNKVTHSNGTVELIKQDQVDLTVLHTFKGENGTVLYKEKTTFDTTGKEIEKEIFDGNERSLSKTERKYDALGREIKTTDTEGNEMLMEYDDFDRLTKVTKKIDDKPIVETYEYPDFARAETAIKAKIDGVVMGKQTVDGFLRVVSETAAHVTTKYKYTEGSTLMNEIITGSGATIKYEFDDKLRQPTSRKVLSEPSLDTEYEYDKKTGFIKKSKNNDARIEYEYDSSNRPIKEKVTLKNKETRESKFTYSLIGKTLTKTDFDKNKRTITYDQHGRPNKIADTKDTNTFDTSNQTVTEVTYDEFNRAIGFVVIDGDKITKLDLELNDAGLETKRVFTVGGEKALEMIQEYNKAMLIKKRITTRYDITSEDDNGKETTEEYTYDKLSRLVTYTVDGEDLPMDHYGKIITKQNFTHDHYGNITKVVSEFPNGKSNIQTFIYNSGVPVRLGKITNTYYGYPAWVLFYYDLNGNLANDENDRWYRYNALGQVDAVLNRDHKYLTHYTYDGQGNLVSQKYPDNNTTEYLYYQEAALINEICDGIISNYLDAAPGLILRKTNSITSTASDNYDATAGLLKTELLLADSKESVVENHIFLPSTNPSSKDKTTPTKLITTYLPYGQHRDKEKK